MLKIMGHTVDQWLMKDRSITGQTLEIDLVHKTLEFCLKDKFNRSINECLLARKVASQRQYSRVLDQYHLVQTKLPTISHPVQTKRCHSSKMKYVQLAPDSGRD